MSPTSTVQSRFLIIGCRAEPSRGSDSRRLRQSACFRRNYWTCRHSNIYVWHSSTQKFTSTSRNERSRQRTTEPHLVQWFFSHPIHLSPFAPTPIHGCRASDSSVHLTDVSGNETLTAMQEFPGTLSPARLHWCRTRSAEALSSRHINTQLNTLQLMN